MLHDRDAALRTLRDAVTGAADGRGAVVLAGGPIGSGRTSLLDETAAIAAADGLLVLRAAAAPVERDFEHGVARQLFDPLLATTGRHVRERWLSPWDGDLPPALGMEPTPADASARHHRVRDLQLLLETVAAERPVAVLVDDVHWADDPSLRWLTHLAVRAAQRPVVLVAGAIDGDPGSGRSLVRQLAASATALRVRRLSDDAVRAVVAERFGRAGDPEFVLACREVSRGIPSVLHAVLGEVAAAGGGPVAAQAPAVRTARPAVLRERIVQCLRGQGEAALRYLRVAAVLGAGADPLAVRRLADLDRSELRTIPAALAEQGLLDETDHTRFAHPIVQEAATRPAEREELHRRAAWVLHELGHRVDEVARHLLAVSSPLEDWAIEVLRASAQESATADLAAPGAGEPDGDASIRHLRRALLDSDMSGHERGVLLVELASAERSVEPATAVRHVSQALSLLDSEHDRAAALTLIDPALARTAPAPVREAIRRADAAGPAGTDEAGRALALRIRSRARRMEEGRPEGLAASCALLREIVAAPDDLLTTSAGRELVGVLLHAAALSGGVPASDVADLGERLLRITPAREMPVPHGVPPGDGPRGLLVLALVAADRPAGLAAWLAPSGPSADPSASPEELAMAHLARGRVWEAWSVHGPVLRDLTAPAPSSFHAALVAAAVETRSLDPGPEVAERPPGAGLTAHATHQMVRAAAAVLRGECDLALQCLLDCGRHLDHLGWTNPALFPWRSWSARLQRRRGDHAAAIAHADADLELAQAWGAPAALGRALRVRGVLVGGSAGGAQLRSAVEVLEGSADRGELGRAEIALGRHLSAAGDPVGEELLSRGRRRIVESGGSDAGPVEPGRDAAPPVEVPAPARVGGGPGSDTGTAAGPAPVPDTGSEVTDVLTDAERQVVDRVVGGATNQKIAEELGVSRRAVEKRLTSAYRKLGVSGRSALPGVG